MLQLLDGWFAVAARGSSGAGGAGGSSAAASSRSPSRRHVTWSSEVAGSPRSPQSRPNQTGLEDAHPVLPDAAAMIPFELHNLSSVGGDVDAVTSHSPIPSSMQLCKHEHLLCMESGAESTAWPLCRWAQADAI